MIGFSPQSRVFRRRTRKTRKQTKRGATPEMGEIPERGWNFDGATNRQAHARRLLVAVQEKVGNARLLSTRNHGWSHCWIGGGTTCLGMSIDHGMRNSWTVRVRLLRRQKITVLRAYLYRIPPSSRYSGSCTRSSSKPGAKKEIKKFDRIPDPGLFSLSLIWPMSPCQITLAPVRLRLLAIESRGKFSFFFIFFQGGGKVWFDVLRVITLRSRGQNQSIPKAPGSIIILALLIRCVRSTVHNHTRWPEYRFGFRFKFIRD